MDLNQFCEELSRLLQATGSQLTESDVRSATRECRDDIYADAKKFGEPLEEPFFNFVCRDGIAVFTFFESQFSVFIVSSDERTLIAESDQFAMCETEDCKEMLRIKFNKERPDIAIPRAVAEHWSS